MKKWSSGALLLILCAMTAAAQGGGPSGWEEERGANGDLVMRRDPHGNWSTYRSSRDGRTTTITHFRNGAGQWQEVWISDIVGQRVVELVRPGVPRLDDYAKLLRRFGLAPGKPIGRSWLGWEVDGPSSRFVAESPLGRFERVEPLGDGSTRRETTSVLGRSFAIEVSPVEDGQLLRDEAGGWRLEQYDSNGLVTARDADGVVVRVARDQLGRPVSYRLGEVGLLRFTYGDSTPQWTS